MNKFYKVEIEETLQRVVNVKADSEEEALDIVETKYDEQEIVLDSEDYIGKEIRIFKDEVTTTEHSKKYIKGLHSKVGKYDRELLEKQKEWQEILDLKPKELTDIQFHSIIEQTRLDNDLLEKFLNNEPILCKQLIYKGADKEYFYKEVSKIAKGNLTITQTKLLEDLHNIHREKHYSFVYDREISDPRIITEEKYKMLLDKLSKKEEFTFDEMDLFLLEDKGTFIAIDNSSSEMFTEEFEEKEKAIRYLQGESIDKLREEECKYEARIYETEEDYNKGESIQLNVYSDLEYAKQELVDTINFNNYHSGNILNQQTGEEVFSL